jgi:hypothetical protein
MTLGDFVEPVANGEGFNQAPVGRCVWALIGSGTPFLSRGDYRRFLVFEPRNTRNTRKRIAERLSVCKMGLRPVCG